MSSKLKNLEQCKPEILKKIVEDMSVEITSGQTIYDESLLYAFNNNYFLVAARLYLQQDKLYMQISEQSIKDLFDEKSYQLELSLMITSLLGK